MLFLKKGIRNYSLQKLLIPANRLNGGFLNALALFKLIFWLQITMQASRGIKQMIAIYIAVIFFVGLDRFLKLLALADRERQLNLIGQFFKFSYQANRYIAFSLPLGGKLLVAAVGLILAALILSAGYYAGKHEAGKLLSLFLIILGAGSNLLDRIKYGQVIDYLDLKYFTVFNLSDVMIVTGVILFIVISYKKK